DPNEKFKSEVRKEGKCAFRPWCIILSANLTIVTVILLLLYMMLTEVGPLPPYRLYQQSCLAVKCDNSKGLSCINGICQCSSERWYWFNKTRCRECPTSWNIISNNCYYISTIRLNYTDAIQWCSSSNSRLLVIEDQTKFVTLQSLTAFQFNVGDLYWIGLSETGQLTYIYQWITGVSFSASNNGWFCSGQPLNSYNYYFRLYDQCITLYVQTSISTCFQDHSCPDAKQFICEL
ncbi:unnamed protein product, partial [Didymodactylos carnosus]